MSIAKDLLDRIVKIATSTDVVVLPVGNTPTEMRGITQIGSQWSKLREAVGKAFGAGALIAASLTAAPAMAAGVGYDANVYGQTGGQVMQQGQGIPAIVEGVRPVMIELGQEARRGNAAITYGIPAGGAAIGGLVGSAMAKSSSGKQIGAIVGGVAGGLAGVAAADAMSGPGEAKQVPGLELTVRNPVTNNLAVITQAGEQSYVKGDRVLVVSVGNSVRVVPDQSRSAERTFASPPQQMSSMDFSRQDAATEIVKTANLLGLKIDPMRVAMQVEPGPVPNQTFSGKVVAVDPDRALVYQEIGRGEGTVHSFSKLSRVPSVGEFVRVQYSSGRAVVGGKSNSRGGAER